MNVCVLLELNNTISKAKQPPLLCLHRSCHAAMASHLDIVQPLDQLSTQQCHLASELGPLQLSFHLFAIYNADPTNHIVMSVPVVSGHSYTAAPEARLVV